VPGSRAAAVCTGAPNARSEGLARIGSEGAAMIYVGTSGFKFDDWKGHFYPEGLKDKEWLEYYSQRFNCLEVNSTYYRLMHPAVFFHMANKVPERFEFTVKTYRSLTHEAGTDNAADFTAFIDSMRPLIEAGKFGCVLAQFPTSFHNTPGSRAYLSHLCDRFSEYPLVIEFRNREWVKDEVIQLLRERAVGWCAVDEPQFRSLMPPIVEATSPIGYVRFHGRNAKQWWSNDSKLRYDYLYSKDELQEWIPKITGLAQQTQKVYVFMNNCYQGKAATNAVELRGLLENTGAAMG
jgi:uncharacterized protein YecE (DUF72 family)